MEGGEAYEEQISGFYNPDEELEQVDYSELVDKLEDGRFLETIRTSEEWGVFREAWRRIYEEADKQLDNIDPANTAGIISCQLTKRFYKDVLGMTIYKTKVDAKAAYTEAHEQGILGKVTAFFKK